MTTDLATQLAHAWSAMPAHQRHDAHKALIAMRDQAMTRAAADLDLVHLITQVLKHTQGATP